MKRRIAVFGATGSIGTAVLDVVRLDPDRYDTSVLVAYHDVEALTALCARHQPDLAIIADPALEADLVRRLAAAGLRCEVASGPEAIIHAAASALCNTVVAAIPGLAGVDATLAAARAGKRLLLGTQESAATAGPLLRRALAEGGGECVPLEPGLLSASQCLNGEPDLQPEQCLTLIGPGGPFLGRRRAELMTVTPEQLCRPTDRFTRRKAAIDSASLMNRGMQLLMAHTLFHLAPEQIAQQLHPDGRVQARIACADVVVRSQDGPADLRATLACALHSPRATSPHLASEDPVPAEKPDLATFRCLALAHAALQAGGDAPAILNAAHDIAVEAFLAGSLPFLSIADLAEQVLTELPPQAVVDIQTLSERDQAARAAARRVLRNAC